MEDFLSFTDFPDMILKKLDIFELYKFASANKRWMSWIDDNLNFIAINNDLLFANSFSDLISYYCKPKGEMLTIAIKLRDIRIINLILENGFEPDSIHLYKAGVHFPDLIDRLLEYDIIFDDAHLYGLAKAGNLELLKKYGVKESIAEAYIYKRQNVIDWFEENGMDPPVPRYNLPFDTYYGNKFKFQCSIIPHDGMVTLVRLRHGIATPGEILTKQPYESIKWCMKHNVFVTDLIQLIDMLKTFSIHRTRRLLDEEPSFVYKYSILQQIIQCAVKYHRFEFLDNVKDLLMPVDYESYIYIKNRQEIDYDMLQLFSITNDNLGLLQIACTHVEVNKHIYSDALRKDLSLHKFLVRKYGMGPKLTPDTVLQFNYLLANNLMDQKYIDKVLSMTEGGKVTDDVLYIVNTRFR